MISVQVPVSAPLQPSWPAETSHGIEVFVVINESDCASATVYYSIERACAYILDWCNWAGEPINVDPNTKPNEVAPGVWRFGPYTIIKGFLRL